MTHRYTLLLGGTVIAGLDEPDAAAIAWAEDTVIAVGDENDVRAISRGDSHTFDLAGAHVIPLGDGPDASWPTTARLEIGGPADLAIVFGDPRRATGSGPRHLEAKALIRGGRVVGGRLPGHGSGG